MDRQVFEGTDPYFRLEIDNLAVNTRSGNSMQLYMYCALVFMVYFKLHSELNSNLFFGVATSLISVLMLPVLLVTCCISAAYRYWAESCLRKSPNFRGLMNGSDAFWACESENTRCIINILMMIDFSKAVDEGRSPLEIMRENMKIAVEKASFKFKCRKKLSRFGFFYFEKFEFDVNDLVRHINSDVRRKEDLEKFISEISNAPISGGSLWEVLVGREESCGSYAVIFRIHHAVGDGYSVVRFIQDHLSDTTFESKNNQKTGVNCNGDAVQQISQGINGALSKVLAYMYAPVMLAHLVLPPPDKNPLHNRLYLSKNKICRFVNLDLDFVKELRRVVKAKFTDVLLFAVAESLESHFERCGEEVDNVRAVVPIRLKEHSGGTTGMVNHFTTAIFKLQTRGCEKLRWLQEERQGMQKLIDHYVSHWLVWSVFTIFPATMVAKYVSSNICSISMSNVPGPTSSTKFGGCELKSLGFFLPNRDTTGVGVSTSSYKNTLKVGLSIDESLLRSPDEADRFLEDIVKSLKQMRNGVVQNIDTTQNLYEKLRLTR